MTKRKDKMRVCISVLLVTVLLAANGAAFSYAADSGTGTSAGVSGASTAAMLLASMGVISADSSGGYNLSSTVTRAEFAKMIVMASSYKDLVQTASYSSPYKDVPAKNWAAPYIRIAVSKGLMSGYSDGTFRPDGIITLEQGVNSVLKLLGYSQSDFVGAFPYAQMNVYSNSGLSKNIAGGIGSYMTRGDAANLIYNLMSTTLKDGSKTYAESLGYSLNASGEVDYAGIINDNMNGPYTVRSSGWANDLGLSASGLTVYKNGSVVTASDVKPYDILYYSQSKGTVWAYDDKVTGIYQKALPSQNAVTSVTVSGSEYQLESAAAFSALSSTGTLKIGSPVTLLLGKNGGVADAVSSALVNETAIVYVTETGTKTYENSDGSQYTSRYIKGVKPGGSEIEYAVDQTWIKVGTLLKIDFDSDGKMNISSVSSEGRISGKVDPDLYTIGTTKIAANATIWDVSLGNYTATSLARLAGVTLKSGDVLYYEASGGTANLLILDDVTGDTAKYGILTSARSDSDSESDSSSSSSASSGSNSYTCLIGGVSSTFTASGVLGAKTGPAKLYGENGKISMARNLNSLMSTRVDTFSSTEVTADTDIGTYPISSDVTVYSNTGGVYKLSTMSDALAAFNSNKLVTFYYDKDPDEGGCIRIIVY
ncbi:MAG TPA: S-layer homology domain-containing protein [Bacillota bacterium]|nr:S-layer homology domain-containing protein [Bacillota bacterium]